ncbi:hypothetical protein GCM10022243_30900 [Saccharothrix violaceirubra]|uniref:Uncharacterized protein n=1 Tax=Saccharothrix violaceirubra TaxID=413306 RepID=A0A7W7T535_9PSEU|nr:hypothetical protein [Saccharothrix violaceirubra]MBB4966715.1 hypothetical protein [Saccharothrix violaceirubra]
MISTAPLSDDWRRQLVEAFELLLDGPLSRHPVDAVYATFLDGNLIHELEFHRDPAWVRPAALRGAEPVVWDLPLFDEDATAPTLDAAHSIFEVDGRDPAPHPAFHADLAAVAFAPGLVRGADLAVVAERHGVDLADGTWAGRWCVAYARLVSDGTLFDAMRVALALGDGPDGVLPLEAEAGEEWAEALEAVENPALRAHLAYFCTDGEEGLIYAGTDRTGGDILAGAGCEVVAHWEEGQSQVEFTVVRLSDLVAGTVK